MSMLLGFLPGAHAFIDEILNQFAGGGGGGQQFHFQMGGGGGMFGGQEMEEIEFPPGISDKITKKFDWLKGTEWNWNNWRNVKFNKDGTFDAPTQDCRSGQCIWSANKGKVFIMWGDAGLHELTIQGEMPAEQKPELLQGMMMKGVRVNDRQRCQAKFQRVFDHEAAELNKDLYGILGLEDSADEADLKKAYRKLSIKYHPDKNPDAESKAKFNEVRDAYEILNDPDKKILYDTGGMEAVKAKDKGEVEKGNSMTLSASVSLADLYNGAQTKFPITRRIVCRGCRMKPDKPNCQGCGRCPNEVKMVNRQVGPGMVIQQQQEVQSKEKCKQERTFIEVTIEKGMREGDQLTFPRMAEQRPNMIPGDVLVSLDQEKDKRFTRRGDDLHMTAKVTLREALIGFKKRIKHMDGRIVEFETESVTAPLQVFKVKGEGMPLRDDPASFGNLFIKVEVVFPKSIPKDQRDAVASLFQGTSDKQEL